LLGALRERLWRRSFSPLDAFVFEKAIAPAVAKIIGPVVSGLVHGPQVLDVGCGGGLIAGSVAASCGATVIGVDPSSAQVRRFNKRHRKMDSLRALRARAESLPFSGASFDSLYSSCVWKHWPDSARGTAECARVLRPGGAIVFIEIDRSSSKEDWLRFASSGDVPTGLRHLVVWFTLKLVSPVAPDAASLRSSFDGLDVEMVSVSKMTDLPFLVCTARSPD
jgi:ubiquinone/menaquinone biosynthesis C-methylase UbiE